MNVKDVVTRDVVTLPGSASVIDAASDMASIPIGPMLFTLAAAPVSFGTLICLAIALRLAQEKPRHIVVGYCMDHRAAQKTVADLAENVPNGAAIAVAKEPCAPMAVARGRSPHAQATRKCVRVSFARFSRAAGASQFGDGRNAFVKHDMGRSAQATGSKGSSRPRGEP